MERYDFNAFIAVALFAVALFVMLFKLARDDEEAQFFWLVSAGTAWVVGAAAVAVGSVLF